MKFVVVLPTLILILTTMATALSVQELLERNKFVPITIISDGGDLLTEK
jgi:hypothetical protein